MRQIAEYETIHDFWLGLTAELAEKPTERKNFYQQQLRASSSAGDLLVRVTFRDLGPTSLRVSHKMDWRNQNVVTKLDFNSEFFDEYETWRRVGHLSTSGGLSLTRHGLHLVETADIPLAEKHELDQGLELLV